MVCISCVHKAKPSPRSGEQPLTTQYTLEGYSSYYDCARACVDNSECVASIYDNDSGQCSLWGQNTLSDNNVQDENSTFCVWRSGTGEKYKSTNTYQWAHDVQSAVDDSILTTSCDPTCVQVDPIDDAVYGCVGITTGVIWEYGDPSYYEVNPHSYPACFPGQHGYNNDAGDPPNCQWLTKDQCENGDSSLTPHFAACSTKNLGYDGLGQTQQAYMEQREDHQMGYIPNNPPGFWGQNYGDKGTTCEDYINGTAVGWPKRVCEYFGW